MISWPYNLTIRPLDRPGTTPEAARRLSPFSAELQSTAWLLERELAMLNARRPVLMLNVRERDLRADGNLRADARPEGPAVALAFESPHGPLRYACDRFTDWQDNLRAIVLGLEALRKITRYGIASRGEQYRGYLAIEAQADDPMAVLRKHAGTDEDLPPLTLYRRACARVHPDRPGTGDREAFEAVQAARAELERLGRW